MESEGSGAREIIGYKGECQLHKTCHTYPYISCGDRQRSALLHHASLNFHSNYNGVSLVEDTVWQYPKLTREDCNVFVLLAKALLQLLCRINDKGTAASAPNLRPFRINGDTPFANIRPIASETSTDNMSTQYSRPKVSVQFLKIILLFICSKLVLYQSVFQG